MKSEVLEGTICDACGSYEFECREEEYFCVTCQLPAKAMEEHPPEKKDVEADNSGI